MCECHGWVALRMRKLGQPMVNGPGIRNCGLGAVCSMAGSIGASFRERPLGRICEARTVRARAEGGDGSSRTDGSVQGNGTVGVFPERRGSHRAGAAIPPHPKT